jgi:uncharacterized protein
MGGSFRSGVEPSGSELAGALPSAPASAKPGIDLLSMSGLELEARSGTLRIRVRVKPRSSKSGIVGVREGALEVAVAAPPVDGAANLEVIRTLSAALGCGKSTIEIVSGERSRSKLVAISGFTVAELLAKLEPRGLPAGG